MFSALADNEAVITGLGDGQDNRSTAAALAAMGAQIERSADRCLVRGIGLRNLRKPLGALDCGNSGTTMRLLCGLVAGRPFETRLTGDASLSRRPMGRIAKPLQLMGAQVQGETFSGGTKAGDIHAPLTVQGGALEAISYQSPVASAQLKTAIVLAALQAQGTTTVTEPALSRDHTERMLTKMGAPLVVSNDGLTVTVDPDSWDGRLRAHSIAVPGDLSSAAFVLCAAAMVPKSDVTVENVLLNPTRTGVLDALKLMGADMRVQETGDALGEPVGTVNVRAGGLRGSLVSGELALRCLDEIPVLAMAAAVAEGETVFADLAELRVKESDRITAVVRELRRAGVDVEEKAEGFIVQGNPGLVGSGGQVRSDHDHRIAMSAAVLGLVCDGETHIPETDIGTSFPSFAQLFSDLGASVNRV